MSQTHQETKGEKYQINKIRNENGEITIDNTEIQRNIRNYYQQSYAKKKKNGQHGRNGQILRKVQLSKLNQEEIKNLNRPLTKHGN